jgi:hypothetical protein
VADHSVPRSSMVFASATIPDDSIERRAICLTLNLLSR